VAKKKKQDEEIREAEAAVEAPSAEETLQAALDEKNDQLLRLAAEYDNFRKRSKKEREELYTAIRSDIVREFLGVAENLERAAVADADAADYKKGVEMIAKQFWDILIKLNVQSFGEAGEPFDPKLHDAVMHTDDENLPENSIAQVFSKGFKIGETVIRPATVQVAN